MKKWKRSLLLMLGVLIMLPTAALAYDEIEVEIPVTTNEACRIELSGDAEGEQIIDGTGAFVVPVSHPGTYTCQVRQIPGDDENKTYDERVYNVTIFVESDGDDLKSATIIYIDGVSEKPISLTFENHTDTPDTPDTPGTPDTPDTPNTPNYHKNNHTKGSNIPKTGDNSRLWVWIGTLAGTVVLLAVILIAWRRRKSHGGEKK